MLHSHFSLPQFLVCVIKMAACAGDALFVSDTIQKLQYSHPVMSATSASHTVMPSRSSDSFRPNYPLLGAWIKYNMLFHS